MSECGGPYVKTWTLYGRCDNYDDNDENENSVVLLVAKCSKFLLL